MTRKSDLYAQEKQNEAVSKAEDVESKIQWAIRKHKETVVVNRSLQRLLDIEKELVQLEDKLPTLTSDVEFEENIQKLEGYLEETVMIKDELEDLDQKSDY